MAKNGLSTTQSLAPLDTSRTLESIRVWCIAIAILAALLGFAGDALGVLVLTAIRSDWPAMSPNTAIGILILALSASLINGSQPQRWIAATGLLLPALIGAGTLLQYITGVNLGLDELFLKTRIIQPALSGRPAPETAICLLSAAASIWILILQEKPKANASQVLVLLVAAFSILALTGYFSGVETLYSLFVQQKHVGMALLTAIALLSISLATLLSKPQLGLMNLITSPTQGGTVARRLVTASIVTPPLVGILGLLGVEVGILREELRLTLAPFLGSGVLLLLTWVTARRLDLLDQRRLNSEKELAESESRLKAILEVVPVGLWWTDAEGKITHGNAMGQQIWRGTRYVGPKEFGQYKAWWIDSGKPIAPDEWALARAITRGEVSIGEQIEIECFDGNHKYVLNSALPFKDEKGQTLGAVAVNLDITEQIRLERKLRLLAETGRVLLSPAEYEGKFFQIARLSVPEFADWCTIYLLDEKERLKRFAAVYRDSSLGSLAKKTFETYSPSSESSGGLYQVLRTGVPVLVPKVEESHLVQVIRDESFRDAFRALVQSYIIVPLILKGTTIGVLSFVRGESGRHFESYDLELAQNLAVLVSLASENAKLMQEARTAARSREEMVAIVSHDLRNPISAIRLAALAMKGSFSGKVQFETEHLAKLSESILLSSESMNRLVQDLLDLSKMEAGKFIVIKEQHDLSLLLSQVEFLYSMLSKEKGLTLSIHRPPRSIQVEMDQERMLQVLSNLIGNALKFTPPGGCIDVKTYESEGELIIEVADTGHGIAESELPHLFERYWQSARSRKKGAGLGLFICRGIIEAHGGRIWVESTKGQGSRFFVAIPSDQAMITQRERQRTV